MFESDYARCEYIEKDNVVFHVWKKEAHFEDYRDPNEPEDRELPMDDQFPDGMFRFEKRIME